MRHGSWEMGPARIRCGHRDTARGRQAEPDGGDMPERREQVREVEEPGRRGERVSRARLQRLENAEKCDMCKNELINHNWRNTHTHTHILDLGLSVRQATVLGLALVA